MITSADDTDFDGRGGGGDLGGARGVNPRMVYPYQCYRRSNRDAAVVGGVVVVSLIEGIGYDDDGNVVLMIVHGDNRYSGDGRYEAIVVGISGRRNAAAPHPTLVPGGRGGGSGSMSVSGDPPPGRRQRQDPGRGWGTYTSPPRGYVRYRKMVTVRAGTIYPPELTTSASFYRLDTTATATGDCRCRSWRQQMASHV